ncbi:hypothetical protein [Bacillus cereus group sp. BfR-BA-01380]|uniref:hypothetical protein n=1 Tax=Bacillus cereus group sp. BfR-BA-01380 TaxID=2920324 RepID=UPI001F56C9E0|nr:hypothetical protein [Bacillus cereus group sp. BfR-BA-01380]
MSDKLRPAELRKSRKYYVSSVHEIASVRLEILDRYIGEDKQVWLKYKMIDTGEISENREVNINSSIYKFRRKQMAQAFEEDNPELFDQNASYKRVLEELDNVSKQLTTLLYNQTLLMQEIRELKKGKVTI